MFAALCTTFCFAITPVFAHGSARRLGPLRANFWRLIVAMVVLGGWAHLFGVGLRGGAFDWFFLGGVVGFGIGGVAMFQSLPRLGANLSTLIVQCASVVTAAAVEWVWLGTELTARQMAFAGMVITGLVIGLLPRSMPALRGADWAAGVAWALVSALGQGTGAVLSRKAFAVLAEMNQIVDPGSAAYQRVIGGLAVAAVVLALAHRRERAVAPGPAGRWVLGNAFTGPVLGVTFYQWALRTTPAGVVQPIVAAAPLLTIPLSMWIEGAARPRRTYYYGCVLAILGVSGLMLR
jgi:drug/metabolite transporter (DMT)-like permease